MSVVPSRPLALPADIFLVADEYILNRAKVNISSGIPTAGVELSSADFLKIFQGTFHASPNDNPTRDQRDHAHTVCADLERVVTIIDLLPITIIDGSRGLHTVEVPVASSLWS